MLHLLAVSTDTTITTMITVFDLPVFNFTANDTATCPSQSVNFTNSSPLPGTCLWHFGDGSTSSVCNTNHSYQKSGVYDITLTFSSSDNCPSTKTKKEWITIYDNPKADFYYDPKLPDVLNPLVVFKDASSSDAIDWNWKFGMNAILGTSAEKNPYLLFPNKEGGTYPVMLMVNNSYGCSDSSSKDIRVYNVISLYVPNSFSPDGDGINDAFHVVYSNLVYFHMMIFDRWGELLFESENPNDSWDGTYRGHPVQMAIYVNVITWRGNDVLDKNNKTSYGHINLLR